MSFTIQVLIGLMAGLGAGIAIRLADIPWLQDLTNAVASLSTLFINAIRMTIIPLVVASLIASVGDAPNARVIGRVAAYAALLFVAFLVAAACFSVLLGHPLFAHLHIDPSAAAGLRARAAASTAAADSADKIPTVSQVLIDILPSNVVRAGADGAMLLLMVFSLIFGLALTRVRADEREILVRFFQGTADAMLVAVRWVLACMPLGVFALTLPLAAQVGLSLAGAIGWYLVAVAGFSIIFSMAFYPLVTVAARIPLRRFARVIAPAQLIGFTARSALTALPTMIEGGSELGLSRPATAFLMPLSVAMFRVGSAIGQTMAVLFVARLYDVSLAPSQFATIIAMVVLTTLGTPPVPAGSIIMIVPVLTAARLPLDGIGLLLGIDVFADMFRTFANVTGMMAVPTIVGRRWSERLDGEEPHGARALAVSDDTSQSLHAQRP